jgi:GAF domain-containing protein
VTLSGEERHTLADEHAALRRVATLVASGATPEKVFGAVTEEVGRMLPVDFADLSRYESDGTITILATWGITQAVLPPGARPRLGGKNLSTLVAQTGASARIEDYADASGPIGAAVRGAGVRSVVGTPIIVDGHMWGMVAAGSSIDKPLPADAEARLASFTELLATAIANAESRGALARLAEEQAALRRVATLVARGAPQKEVFAAVIEEVGGLLPVFNASMARYEPDGTVTAVAAWGEAEIGFPAGSRWSPGGKNLITMVLETGRPARIDNYVDASGPIATAIHDMGVRSAVASPILVQGRLWGVIVAGSNLEQPLAPDTEARLASFTELVATAIANAESRAGLTHLAQEQTALRRVATLVARGMAQADLFRAVTEELGRLLAVDFAIMGRYEGDGTVTSVGGWGAAAARFPVGGRSKLEGENLVTIVLETGRPARVDDFAHASGPIGDVGRQSGFHSAIGAPIVVDGRTWGVMTVGSVLPKPRLPAGTETRLESFTELVATAIANAESHARLGRLAAEQAALRRVATLVAQGVPPEEVFAAVAEEVVQLLAVDFTHMGRYEGDGTVTVVASSGSTAETFRVGRRWNLGGRNLTTIVFETGRSARLDRYSDAFGALGAAGRELGIRSSVGTPILVEDRVWGVVTAGSTVEETLPTDLESRLENFTELAATAIANAQTRAELAASRARIVAATDESRRRIERDLHDGAQQRLVHAVIVLKLALRELADEDANARELLAEALGHAEQANSELRELAHGILPAALTRGGLRAGVEALLSRISLPVRTNVTAERLPPSVEATAYFIISEALTNVVKHAHATRAQVTARLERGELHVEIRDDGVGGAKGSHDSGLGGLRDRVSALEGRLGVVSPPDGGTSLRAQLPIADSTLTQDSSGQ